MTAESKVAAPVGGGLAEVLGLPKPWQCETAMCPNLYTADQMHEYAVNYLRSHGEAIGSLPAFWRQVADELDADPDVFACLPKAIRDCADELDAALAKVASNGASA